MTPPAAAHSRAATASLIILLIVGVMASADDRDIDFAAILIEEFGYTDLAIVVLQETAGNADESKKTRANAHLELAQLYMQLAKTERDTKRKEELTKKAQEHMTAFQGFDVGGGSTEELLELAAIQRDHALNLKREAEKKGVPEEKKKELINKAIAAFDTAIAQYEKILKPLKTEYDKLKEDKKARKREMAEIQESYGTVWFQTLWTKQMKAEIMPEGKARSDLLRKLIEELEDDFVPDFLDWGFEYYGRWLQGTCHWNAAQYKEATECIDETLKDMVERNLMNDLEDVGRKMYLLNADAYADWAVSDKKNGNAHYLNVIKSMDDLFKQFSKVKRPKNDQELGFYCSCRLKKAKAYAAMGEYGKALKEAEWIFENGTAGWKNLISTLVDDEKWLDKADTATANFMAGRKHMIDQAHDKALQSYRKALAKGTLEERGRYAKTAWHHMGICYYNLGHLYEAALAFRELAALGDDKLAKKGLFLRARSLGSQFYASNRKASGKKVPEEKPPKEKPPKEKPPEKKDPEEADPKEKAPEEKDPEEAPPKEKVPAQTREEALAAAAFDSSLWLQAMLDCVGKFPDEDPDMDYHIAERYRVHGDLDKAREWYAKVREKSQHYNKSRFRQPMVLWTMHEELKKNNAEPDKIKLALLDVIMGFKDYVRWSGERRATTDDPKLKADLLKKASTAVELTGHSLLALANLAQTAGQMEDVKRNAKGVVDALDDFEEKYRHRRSFAKIRLLRIQAYAKLLDIENIRKELNKLIETEKKRERRGKKSKSVRDGLATAANAFLSAAEKEQDSVKKKGLNNEAAELFERLLNYDPNQQAEMFIWVGDQLSQMGRHERSAKMYVDFLVKFGAAAETKKEDVLQVHFRLAGSYTELKQHDNAIKHINKLLTEADWEWDARRMLIDAYLGKALMLEGDAQTEYFGRALKIINEDIIPKVKPQGPDWYKFKKKMIEVYLNMGEYRGVIARIEMIDKDYMWGSLDMRKELADMIEKYIDKVKDEELRTRWQTAIEVLRTPVEILDIPEAAAPENEPEEESEEEPEEEESAEKNADEAAEKAEEERVKEEDPVKEDADVAE